MVPLLVALPGGVHGGQRVAQQVRLVDVAPSILDAAGLDPFAETTGSSLLPLIGGSDGGFPDDAWSYAASSNRGVSMRRADRLKYIYNHSAWPPAHGTDELYRLDKDPAEERNLAAGSDDREQLREQALQRLAGVPSGFEIRIRNLGSRTLEGEISGPGVSRYGLKSLGHDASAMTWLRKETARFEVPAGDSLELVVENPEAGTILLSGGFHRPGRDALMTPFELEVEVLGLASGRRLRLEGQTWVEVPPDAELPPATEVRLAVRGAPEDLARPAPTMDDALREQLKALGYVQ
jgi:hypothetical protein